MLDLKKLDSYFNEDSVELTPQPVPTVNRHSRLVGLFKLALPSFAAVLIVLLLVFPSFKQDARDVRLDITRPRQGELEKLHVENTTFYITDKDNQVHNFVAARIDETEPGSKLIKLTTPEGIIPLRNDNWLNLKAPYGFYNQNTNLLEMNEKVEMFYSAGMNVMTAKAFYDFNTARGYGNSPVVGQGFFGSLNAQGFEFSAKTEVLTFVGHSEITVKEESFQK